MAIKLVELKQLGKETNETITSAKNEWISFLDFSAELYRYSTKNKVYMYAQRPDATAVASSKTWNNRMMRWIKKGSKGIGYIVHSNNRDHVEYVFDISDTMGIKGLSGIEPHKWRMNSDDRDQSVPYLIERYHPTLETVNTPTLKDAVNGYVNDYCNEIREDGDFSNETQYLIGSENQWKEFENELSRLIASSSAYLIGRRCGFDNEELDSLADDIDISVFEKYNTDSEMLLNKVGSHIDDISTDFLRDLGTWVDKKHEREKRNEQRQNSIHESRGLLSSESGDGRTKLSSEQVRGNALPVDDGTHEADGRNSELQMRDERTSGSDQQTGRQNDGTADEQNDEREWSNRRTEGSESDAVAKQVYGDSERSGEDRTGSDSLQILEEPETVNQLEEVDSQVLIEQFSLFSEDGDTEEKQIETVRQQASESIEDPLAFLISDELVEKLLVKITSENKAVRDGVAGRLVLNLSDDEFAESLKSHVGKAYILNGIGFSVKGREEREGTYYSLFFADEGIKIGRGKSSENNYDRLVSWSDAAVMIKGLYSSGRWTTDAVINSALTQARMNVAHSIANTFKESEVFAHIPKDILEVEDLVMHSWKNKAVAKSISQGLDRVIERGKSPYNEFAKGYKKDYLQLFGDEIIILQNNSELVDTYEIKSSFVTDDVCNQIIADYMHPTRANGKFILQEMIEDGREQSAINNKIQALYGGETNNLFTNVLFMTGLQIKVPFTDDIRILDWNDVSDRIRTLIEEDKWLDSEEKIQYQKWHENRERENFFEEVVIDGNRCNQIDTWESDNHTYVIGNSIDDTDFYFASVSGIEGDLIQGSATFEYDRQPSRERVESDYIDLMAERDIDAHEAEFGADGSRNFPHREENREQIPQDVIDDLLCSGSGFENGKKRIFEQFKKGMSDKENADFLKHEYGIGGASYIDNHDDYEQNHDAKGILIIKKSQDSFEERARLLLNWGNVAVRIKELINLGLYASEEEIATWAERPSEDVKQISVEEDAALNSSNEDYTPVEETEIEILPQEQIEITKVDQPVPSKVNYEITDELLGVGDKRTKYQWNIDAVKTLKKIESEGRSATEEEQKILSKYVGWGGLSEVFDPSKTSWNREYKELQNILTDSEYSAASESTLTAYYTQPVVIKAIYEALHNMGFEKGNILEPSMGTGNFFGLLPKAFEKSKLYGVEKDSLTGRIAQQLYPNATVKVCGYEESNYSDSFFDVAVGNVPFGNFQVYDRQYNKLHFMIHDYFFAKTVDQLRTGGIMAFITSSGTMDKENSTARKYLAERCDLLGAIRLPNNAFKANAGTEVTSDIIFLKKRETLNPNIESWVDVSTDRNGLTYNSYFVDHPEMVLGTMKEVSGQFGMTLTCEPDTETSLEEQLRSAIKNINGSYEETVLTTNDNDLDNVDETVHTIPADDNVQNFSFCEKDGKLYYRKDSVMEEWKGNKTAEERIRGLIKVRDAVKELIETQVENIDDEGLKQYQEVLNTEYDTYTKKYGLLSSAGNRNAFKEDANYPLLLSLENLDDDGNLVSKADLFTKRTISRYEPVTSCETSNEAMILSLNEKAQIDLEYMSQLCGKSEETMIEDLKGIIYQDPKTKKWQTKDEYLSGNIKEKLSMAQYYAESDEKWQANVDALEKAMPKRVEAAELEVKLGATWVDDRYYTEFLHEKLNAMSWQRLDVTYSEISNEFVVDGFRRGDALYTATYGTGRMNAVDVFENAINFKSPKVYDKVDDRSIFNAKETMLINQKMNMFRQEFKDWIFADQERRDRLVDKYNERFNTTRPREYDGSHLIFPNMNPSIKLRPHQLDAVAHVLYGDNTMLAHVVGAGKTYEMIASCMESERLGLSQKALFVVPNHLTEQWGADFLKLYPSAKVLVAKKTDFTPQNRKAFCARIATGDYDAVIIGHTQFERIPLSNERQESYLRAQIDEITNAIQSESSPFGGQKASVKALERTKRGIERRLKKLLDTKKDQIVTFEQLGIDRLFVDEAHNYKNGFLYTKMQNVAGINNTESNKASDMLLKCRYMDEKTGGKGIVFATGTPISNSMTELYIMQNYLQHDLLKRMHISSFDEWASVFGETETGIELAPEGTGYRMKTRFSKFYNIPELMSVVKESFDIKTSDQLKLPVPDAEYTNVELLPSEFQNIYVKDLADRAEAVRNGSVDNSIDNMLKITNDGRKIALDQRMIDASTGDYEDSKVEACAENAYAIYEKTRDQKSAQVIFCDLSTPKADGTFNVYDEMKKKLIEKGVKEEEIEFIHSADTEKKKTELFRKVNTGDVRILIGSTAKMGAGTNIQNKLIALHHLDIGWRPSDLEQREGRIIRQGNENEKVYIYRYVTKNTFDAYMWQLIENKQKFISQIMTSKSPARTCNDVDETALSYAEVKALATGNPLIKEKMEIDVDVEKLKLLKKSFQQAKWQMESEIKSRYPVEIAQRTQTVEDICCDLNAYRKFKDNDEDFEITLLDRKYTNKEEAGAEIIKICDSFGLQIEGHWQQIGSYHGFDVAVKSSTYGEGFSYSVGLQGKKFYNGQLNRRSKKENISRIDSIFETIETRMNSEKKLLTEAEHNLEVARVEVTKPFAQEEELQKKLARQVELNDLLSMDNTSEEESQDEEPNAVDLIESHQFEADVDDVTVEFENMILYITRTEQDAAKVDYYINNKDTGCMEDCGSWFDDCNVTADLKEAVKAVIKDKDITEQILSVNEGDRFEEITGTLPVRQSGGQSM